MNNRRETYCPIYESSRCPHKRRITQIFLTNDETIEINNSENHSPCVEEGFFCSYKNKDNALSNDEPENPQKASLSKVIKVISAIIAIIGTIFTIIAVYQSYYYNRPFFSFYEDDVKLIINEDGTRGIGPELTLINKGGPIKNVECYLGGYFELKYKGEFLIIEIEKEKLSFNYKENTLTIADDKLASLSRYLNLSRPLSDQSFIDYVTSDLSKDDKERAYRDNCFRITQLLYIQYIDYNGITHFDAYNIDNLNYLKENNVLMSNVNKSVNINVSTKDFYDLVNSFLVNDIDYRFALEFEKIEESINP